MARFANLHLTPDQCAAVWVYGRFRFGSSARWMELVNSADRIATEANNRTRSTTDTACFVVDDRTLDRLHCMMLEIQEQDEPTGHIAEVIQGIVTACEKANEMIA